MNNNVLVVLFLRGGMDGLSAVVPYGDDHYHRARPTIGLGTPKQNGLLDLDGYFALHPTLAPLHALWQEGQLGIYHAIGSADQTRSHFEAMSAMERGVASDTAPEKSGWLARFLNTVKLEKPSPIRAVAFSNVTPDVFRGAREATTIQSLNQLQLQAEGGIQGKFAERLEKLYHKGDDAVVAAGRETLSFLKTLDRIQPNSYLPANTAVYPQTVLGENFKQTACLIKANTGLQVAFLESGGWDTHVTQGGKEGYYANQWMDVTQALAAFHKDLGAEMGRVSVIVKTEFGRRVAENSSLGTDHGRGSALFWMGAGAPTGKVQGIWKPLAPENLEGPGDVPVTTDYRTVLAKVVSERLGGAAHLSTIFPNLPT